MFTYVEQLFIFPRSIHNCWNRKCENVAPSVYIFPQKNIFILKLVAALRFFPSLLRINQLKVKLKLIKKCESCIQGKLGSTATVLINKTKTKTFSLMTLMRLFQLHDMF